jgi:hypothetical protein
MRDERRTEKEGTYLSIISTLTPKATLKLYTVTFGLILRTLHRAWGVRYICSRVASSRVASARKEA